MNKEDVKKKILFYCKKYNIEIPKTWDYLSVKRVADKINSIDDWNKEIENMEKKELIRTNYGAGNDWFYD